MDTEAFVTYKRQSAALSLQYAKDKQALLDKYTADKAAVWKSYLDKQTQESNANKTPEPAKAELTPIIAQQSKKEQESAGIMAGWKVV